MDVTRAARLARCILRHEGHGLAVLLGDFAHALLEEPVHVRHRQRRGAGEVDLVLTAAPLALAALHRHTRGTHVVADGPHQWFIAGRLHEVIINPVIARRLQLAVAADVGCVVGLVEQVKLKLTCAQTGKPLLRQQVQLPSQHRYCWEQYWQRQHERGADLL